MKINLDVRPSFWTISLIIVISHITMAQDLTRQEAGVQNTVIKLFDAISINDAAGIKSSCTTDVKFYEYGQIWTVDTLLQKLSVLSDASVYSRTNKFDFVSTKVKGNIAWVTYYLESTITKNGNIKIVKWMETVILRQEKKQWKISVLHSTRLSDY
jgi:ketosteroid isomerase-like protein